MPDLALVILCWKQNGPLAKQLVAKGQLSSNKSGDGMFKETLTTLEPATAFGFMPDLAFAILCWKQNGPLAKLLVAKGQLSSNKSGDGMFKETLTTLEPATAFGFMPDLAFAILCWKQNGPLAKLLVAKGQLSSNKSGDGMFKETLTTLEPATAFGFMPDLAFAILCWKQNGPLAKLLVTKGQLSSNKSGDGMFKETLTTLEPATALGFMPDFALVILCWKQNGPLAKLLVAKGQLSSNKSGDGMFKETLTTLEPATAFGFMPDLAFAILCWKQNGPLAKLLVAKGRLSSNKSGDGMFKETLTTLEPATVLRIHA